jgi:hypothetical protein
MSIQTHLAALERRHHALDQQIHGELMRSSCDDLKLAGLRRVKLLVKDEILTLRQRVAAVASKTKLSAAETKKAAVRMAKAKSTSWYASATRSISIIKAKPLLKSNMSMSTYMPSGGAEPYSQHMLGSRRDFTGRCAGRREGE